MFEQDISLPLNETHNDYMNEKRSGKLFRVLRAFVFVVLICVLFLSQWKRGKRSSQLSLETISDAACPSVKKLVPYGDGLLGLDQFRTPEYRNYSLLAWSGAVKIPTENFDDLGEVGEDPRWDIFYDMVDYVLKTFPQVSSKTKVEHVNTHGLILTLEGLKAELKPLLLTGHFDVVPVPHETLDKWTHPPFDGVFDGEYLWGRGSSDCKNVVIGILEALERLLDQGFKPQRTLIIAFGFDEETSGHRGASNIAKALLDKLGPKSIYMMVDEGLGLGEIYGTKFALPGTGEKGYVDVNVDLIMDGGHSSVPPRHTAIGIISQLVNEIEKTEYNLDVSPKNPFYYQLQCEAKYATLMDERLRKDIINIDKDPKSKENILKTLDKDPRTKFLASTSQAVDIVYGGVKINALPEKVTVKINHRVSYESSLEEVKTKILNLASQIAKEKVLDLEAYGETFIDNGAAKGKFEISSDSELRTAPLTSIDSPSWHLLGGTIKNVFEDFADYAGENSEVFLSPSSLTGNTDTRYYWNLTDNIYRFGPTRQGKSYNAHTVDERVALDAHIEGVAFYYQLIRNSDNFPDN